MSFPSTIVSDDFDISTPVSQTENLLYDISNNNDNNNNNNNNNNSNNNTPKSTKHLSFAQARGVIQIFNHYFPKNTGKRMSRDEKKKRWNSYKAKILNEYGRAITGKFSSEKALVKRYSDPLSFLKYRLKRANNLRVSDLSVSDQQYYKEIGGLDDVNELIKKTYNIDSVEKLVNPRKRRRLMVNTNNNNNINQNFLENKNDEPSIELLLPNLNRINNNNNNNLISHSTSNITNFNNNNNDDNNNNNIPPKTETMSIRDLKMTQALSNLNNKMDIFEQELLDKKKIEVYEITKQKISALKNSLETSIINEPHLIGFIPGIGSYESQLSIAFDCWLNKYKHTIINDESLKNKLELFIEQIMTLKSDPMEWNRFLSKWKINRILYEDKFQLIWHKIKAELNIDTSIINNNNNNNENNNNHETHKNKNNNITTAGLQIDEETDDF